MNETKIKKKWVFRFITVGFYNFKTSKYYKMELAYSITTNYN